MLEEVLLAPLPDLCHFNRIGAMSDTEASIIHATITNTESRLEALKKQRINAGSLLEQLKECQKELEDSLIAQKSLLAPIRKLPVDVLGEIFLVAERSAGNDSLDDFVLSRRPRDIISRDLELLSSASRDFPLLERLDFAQLGQLYPSRQALPPLSFDSTHCPLLRDVHFQPGAYPTHPATIPITWSQIQRCTVTTWTESVLPTLRLLSANVAVAEIKRRQVSSWAAIDDLEWYLGEEPIHMPHLIDLKIDDVRSGGRHALEFIRAPAMQSLSLVDGSGIASFAAFVAQSRCTLTRLHLTIPLHLGGIVRALKLVPDIVHLSLEGPHSYNSGQEFDEEFFAAMNEATLVPAMTHLSLSGQFYCKVEDALAMLRARNHKTGGGKLRSFELREREISDPSFEYWNLFVLKDEGLEISYHS
ncbi:F-box domain-containing protein [Mycena chlorophos]|uniref:F-box domain-containing protein n=1 Tax=Mycena chlorophos TaxID=658473 RepID=A0A8H6VTJ5_MYCCL|nr:F-box domain-containing protein [Mycena chlorophos]